ncbi:pyridoxamine 5'-phosphate oxidase family protein [Nocardia callitridis]|uniref:Pyridoxamine 5'-phosphate oxidase family protein n=1 Tax=Nocardia callitridis TaxID=648753 RepID=A0ABP9JVM9_9NOCA
MTESALVRTPLSPTERSTPHREADRVRTDRADLDAVLDAEVLCHIGVLLHGTPSVLPTIYGRDGDTLYLHGSTGAGNLRAAMLGDISVAVTLVDGVVYARSAMHCSMNYRSAVVHGRAELVTDHATRLHALRVITEHAAPGTWDRARQPNKKELAATMVLALDLTEASVKVRTGGPNDEPDDIARGGVWSGVLPLRRVWDTPIAAADLDPEVPTPASVHDREPLG